MDNTKQCAYPTGYDGDTGLTKLEAFTLAAMQGLCGKYLITLAKQGDQTEESLLAQLSKCAVDVARATLTELSKQQQP